MGFPKRVKHSVPVDANQQNILADAADDDR